MRSGKKRSKKEEDNQSASFFGQQRGNEFFLQVKEEPGFFPNAGIQIQRQPVVNNSLGIPDYDSRPEIPPMHGNISIRNTNLSQVVHWMAGGAAPPPPRIYIVMELPANAPAISYSDKIQKQGSWEEANFYRSPFPPEFTCVDAGSGLSYVKNIKVGYNNPQFEYLISTEIEDGMKNGSASTKSLWTALDWRLKQHAQEHFARYKAEVVSFKKQMNIELAHLPDSLNPYPMSKEDLEKYVGDLLGYYMEQLQFNLWKTTCDWERADYNQIIADVNKGRVDKFWGSAPKVKNCNAGPYVRPKPALNPVVTPGTKTNANKTGNIQQPSSGTAAETK